MKGRQICRKSHISIHIVEQTAAAYTGKSIVGLQALQLHRVESGEQHPGPVRCWESPFGVTSVAILARWVLMFWSRGVGITNVR